MWFLKFGTKFSIKGPLTREPPGDPRGPRGPQQGPIGPKLVPMGPILGPGARNMGPILGPDGGPNSGPQFGPPIFEAPTPRRCLSPQSPGPGNPISTSTGPCDLGITENQPVWQQLLASHVEILIFVGQITRIWEGHFGHFGEMSLPSNGTFLGT